jgi:hypothetical protein
LHCALTRLDAYVSFNRVGDKTGLVRQVMDMFDLGRCGLGTAGKYDMWAQNDAR